MTPEERRRRRLDRIMAELNRQAAAMHAAMQPTDEEDEPDEGDEQNPRSTP
ncbi:hypothetical protein [Nonomuraea sp. NPDC049400]|uniref:hypothetical protein n=1 Tax=Nonomuraea sp. NPDC049400 TaxID=3364352 RepID=UPI00379A147B